MLSDSKPPPSTYQQAPRHFHVPGRRPGHTAARQADRLSAPELSGQGGGSGPPCLSGVAWSPSLPISLTPKFRDALKVRQWVCASPKWHVFEFLPNLYKHQGGMAALLRMGWREGLTGSQPSLDPRPSHLCPSAPFTRRVASGLSKADVQCEAWMPVAGAGARSLLGTLNLGDGLLLTKER